jgi:hypothetical protein
MAEDKRSETDRHSFATAFNFFTIGSVFLLAEVYGFYLLESITIILVWFLVGIILGMVATSYEAGFGNALVHTAVSLFVLGLFSSIFFASDPNSGSDPNPDWILNFMSKFFEQIMVGFLIIVGMVFPFFVKSIFDTESKK